MDLGESMKVHQKELRVLDDEFYASPLPQVSEDYNSFSCELLTNLIKHSMLVIVMSTKP